MSIVRNRETRKNKRKNHEEEEPADTLFREFVEEEKKTKRMECNKNPKQTDALEDFFLCMSKTAKTFPPLWQSHVKKKVFAIVHSAEEILLRDNSALPSTNSSGNL